MDPAYNRVDSGEPVCERILMAYAGLKVSRPRLGDMLVIDPLVREELVVAQHHALSEVEHALA